MKQRVVAVTGLTGFVGRRLARRLSAMPIGVRALVRREPSRLAAGIQPWLAELGDIDALGRALVGADAVVHLAGTVRGRRARDFAPANVQAVASLCAAAARQTQPPALLLVSSLAAARPALSHYAASKCAGEQALLGHPHLNWTILRPTAVYGPGDVEMKRLFRLLRRGLALAPGNRRQRLSFLHVDDLVEAILCWLRDPGRCRGGQFSIDDGAVDGYDWAAMLAASRFGSGVVVQVPSAALRLAAYANLALSAMFRYAPMLTPGKVRELTQDRWVADDGRFAAVTGWRPRYNLAQGLEQWFGGR